MILHITRPNAVNCVDRTSLKLIKVARDDFSSLLDVWDHDGNLMIVGEFAQALPNAMSYFKVAIRIVLAA